jgi:N-acyl-L-homoserine lactone synthetase
MANTPAAPHDAWRSTALELADRIVAGVAPVQFRLAATVAEREATYRLRAKVVLKYGWKTAAELGGDQERDEYDDRALHLAGWRDDRLVATGRLIPPAPGKLLPVEAAHNLIVEPRGRVVHIDRLVVDPAVRDRGHRLFIGVLVAAARETLYLGHDVCCGIESRSMIRLMRLIGLPVTILGPALPYWGAERFPVRFDLRDALSFLAAHAEPNPI